jgi:anti-sigma factor RsiW
MTRCDETRARMMLYLDDELEPGECGAIESHLANCDRCRAVFESERRLLEIVRQSRPLPAASPQLRAAVENLLESSSSTAPAAPAGLRRRIQQLPGGPPAARAAGRYVWVAAALVLLVLLAGVWRFHKRSDRPRSPATSEFAVMAAGTHQRHTQGQLPLEIVSTVPGQISAWFAGKVPFVLQLPNYQESSGQEKLYGLEGARLVGYKNDYAAYVAYQMRSSPISLLVTSAAVAQPSGGEEIVSRGITFHYNSINGLKVITWSDRGLTYALVSNLEERGQQSCVVCHQGTKDRDFIESLKPK